MEKSSIQKQKKFKESLEELYGHNISEQDAFAAQYDLSELLQVLDEIDRALPQKDVHGKSDEDAKLQGGVK